ncbi:hypothetical protein DFH07DRAFT_397321 [Mycena maculata]|uniref:Uncharacterized protein n=1 Tax=Mycena maculata TaxID=230809 RepID=A0AAD7H615_9AGAR|nr:hypothetical protein DFH07DRAFT_397321 [Mycena maculata]
MLETLKQEIIFTRHVHTTRISFKRRTPTGMWSPEQDGRGVAATGTHLKPQARWLRSVTCTRVSRRIGPRCARGNSPRPPKPSTSGPRPITKRKCALTDRKPVLPISHFPSTPAHENPARHTHHPALGAPCMYIQADSTPASTSQIHHECSTKRRGQLEPRKVQGALEEHGATHYHANPPPPPHGTRCDDRADTTNKCEVREARGCLAPAKESGIARITSPPLPPGPPAANASSLVRRMPSQGKGAQRRPHTARTTELHPHPGLIPAAETEQSLVPLHRLSAHQRTAETCEACVHHLPASAPPAVKKKEKRHSGRERATNSRMRAQMPKYTDTRRGTCGCR